MLLLANGWVSAQNAPEPTGRGSAPLMNLSNLETGETRALVIGISKYMDDGITDLQFAHRDAEIFNEYLRSNAGGALPAKNIRLLTNEQATLAAIDLALDWLEHASKKGDKAILYFSGHGDVEKQTLWQRGYLLAHDTPANNFRNNAVKVEDLDDLVKTLSVGRETKVIIILDACRAGKLANAGTSLTNEQLAKQVENEVRILACKADQKSLEGNQWGQGRGLFSYYLVNGLKGLADEQNDQVVTFEEMKSFLETNVRKALSSANIDARQNPVLIGDESYELAAVDELTLLALNQEMAATAINMIASADGVTPKSGSDNEASMAADKGIGGVAMAVMAEPLTAAPPMIATLISDATLESFLKSAEIKDIVLSPAFEKALKSREDLLDYFSKELASQNLGGDSDHFAKLLRQAEKDPLKREELAMQLVVELNNRTQVAINAYLRVDANELAERQFRDLAMQYIQYPRMLQAAILLAGQDYSQLARMQVKYHYFDGVCSRLQRQMGLPDPGGLSPMQKQKLALAIDDEAAAALHEPGNMYQVGENAIRCQPPYVHNEIGVLYLQENKFDSALYHFDLAAKLAPNWAIPYSNLAIVYKEGKQLEKAKELAIKAIELKPDYSNANVNLGNIWLNENNILKAETAYRKAITLDKNYFIVYEQMGHLMALRTEYMKADWYFNEAEKLKKDAVLLVGTKGGANNLTYSPNSNPIIAQGRSMFPSFSEPTTEAEFLERGIFYFKEGMYSTAEIYLRGVLNFNTENEQVYDYLGRSLYHLQRYEEAELALNKLLKLRPDEPHLKLYLADVYIKQQRRLEEEELYMKLLEENPAPSDLAKQLYERMNNLLRHQKRYPEQEKWLVKYVELFKASDNVLTAFYEEMAKLFPQNTDWLYRLAANYNQTGRDWNGAEIFVSIIALDTTYPAIAHMHERIGANASDPQNAIWHYKEAIRIDSGQVAAKHGLVTNYRIQRMFEEEIPVLEDLLKNQQIDLLHRMELGDLYALSGKFAEADSLLTKADKIKFEPTLGLNEIRGKLAMYQGRHEEAIQFYESEIALKSENYRRDNYYTLAHLAAKAGNQAAALQWLEMALERGFNNYHWVIQYDAVWRDYKVLEGFKDLMVEYKIGI